MQTIRFEKLQLNKNQTLLDLGCGEGRHAIGALYEQPDINVFYVDLNFNDLTVAKERLEGFFQPAKKPALAVQANGLALPFENESFDYIVCSEVLEHIPQHHQMIKEIHRLLKPGGTLAVSVPRYWPEKICWWLSREYHQVEGGHIRIFKSNELSSLFTQLDYKKQAHHWAHALHSPYWWLRCMFWQRGEQFCIVRWYHRFLVWDLLQKPKLTRYLEKMLNPLFGKSIVMYFIKPIEKASV